MTMNANTATIGHNPAVELVGREATFEERATWGTCSVCGAKPGEWCWSDVGFRFGDVKTGQGVHLVRLQRAPKRVKLVACE